MFAEWHVDTLTGLQYEGDRDKIGAVPDGTIITVTGSGIDPDAK